MAVLGDSEASLLRHQMWKFDDEKWELTRATWAPSELTTLPAEAFDALLGLEGKVRTAVTEGKTSEKPI
jgi:hypothetical protein